MLRLNREGEAGYLQDHNLLKNLDAPDQHPIASIIGLRKELDKTQPISHIEGLQEALDSKYVKPDDGIPLTDLAEVVTTQIEFLNFVQQCLDTIAQLNSTDEDLLEYIERVDADLTNFKELMNRQLREINLLLESMSLKVDDVVNSMAAVKDEIITLRKEMNDLINEIFDQLRLNEELIHEVEELKHMILNINRLVVVQSNRIDKNSSDIQKLAEAHKDLLRLLESGDACDLHLPTQEDKECEHPPTIGRTYIEQIDKANVSAGYSFEINTRDNNLRVIEPTVLKLSIKDRSTVDILSDFDYNNREDFIATDSVIISDGIRITDDVALRGQFKEVYNKYDVYCYESLDTSPYEDVISLYSNDGYILIESDGAVIKYLNSRLEVKFFDLTGERSVYNDDHISVYGNSNISLDLNMAYSRLDFKVRIRNQAEIFGEYEIPASLIDFSKELVVKSQEECFSEYR